VSAYFKGGTSLSNVFGLIRRFSEDVDILALLRHDDSAGARHKVSRSRRG
jgi:predicted nucleotidyltransferase component of viral defense system